MAQLLSTAQIAALRVLQETAMPDTATITTITQVDDGAGSFTLVTATSTSKCRLTANNGNETDGDQRAERGAYRLALPVTATITNTSRVTVGGRTFNVVWTPPLTGFSTARIVGLEDA